MKASHLLPAGEASERRRLLGIVAPLPRRSYVSRGARTIVLVWASADETLSPSACLLLGGIFEPAFAPGLTAPPAISQ